MVGGRNRTKNKMVNSGNSRHHQTKIFKHVDFIRIIKALVLCRVAAVKRLPVHQP